MGSKAKKTVGSFEESRKKLLSKFCARTQDQIVTREIHFNDDVPLFLEQLAEFEKRSRKTVITVK